MSLNLEAPTLILPPDKISLFNSADLDLKSMASSTILEISLEAIPIFFILSVKSLRTLGVKPSKAIFPFLTTSFELIIKRASICEMV